MHAMYVLEPWLNRRAACAMQHRHRQGSSVTSSMQLRRCLPKACWVQSQVLSTERCEKRCAWRTCVLKHAPAKTAA